MSENTHTLLFPLFPIEAMKESCIFILMQLYTVHCHSFPDYNWNNDLLQNVNTVNVNTQNARAGTFFSTLRVLISSPTDKNQTLVFLYFSTLVISRNYGRSLGFRQSSQIPTVLHVYNYICTYYLLYCLDALLHYLSQIAILYNIY